jgi:signal transduction histidine kinase
LFGLLVVAVLLWIPVFQSKTVSYVIFLLAICLSSFVGTFTSGFLLTGFATSTLILFFQPTLLSLQSSIEILSFIATGIVISVIIHRCKRADLGNEFARREHEYKKTISQLTQEKLEAIKEIRVRDEFISIASHELKTPLTTTLLKLQTALHNVRHVTLANFSVQNLLDMLESAELQSKRLAKMINDLLNVSIIRTGRLELEREECDVVVIAKEVVNRFAEKAEKEGVELRVDAKGTIPAFCDKVRLEQVISNLISNAIKYGKAKPIDVFVWKSGNVAKISIKDRGIGISPDKREKVFNLFERAVGNGE